MDAVEDRGWSLHRQVIQLCSPASCTHGGTCRSFYLLHSLPQNWCKADGEMAGALSRQWEQYKTMAITCQQLGEKIRDTNIHEEIKGDTGSQDAEIEGGSDPQQIKVAPIYCWANWDRLHGAAWPPSCLLASVGWASCSHLSQRSHHRAFFFGKCNSTLSRFTVLSVACLLPPFFSSPPIFLFFLINKCFT